MTIRLYKYQRMKPFDNPTMDQQALIKFPLPTTLGDSTGAEFSSENLGPIGSILDGDYLGGASSAMMTGVTSLPHLLSGNGSAGPVGALEKFGDKLGGWISKNLNLGGLPSAIAVNSGMAPNPNPAIMFKGPELRGFSFSWLLQPFDQEESDRLKKSIKTLKAYSLPSNTIKDTTGILNYPSLAQINFYPWDGPYAGTEWGWGEDSIIRIKKCFISNVEVNYTPSNTPAFFAGDQRPVTTQLTLTFRETEFVMGSDWDDSLASKSDFFAAAKEWAVKGSGGFGQDIGGAIMAGVENFTEAQQ